MNRTKRITGSMMLAALLAASAAVAANAQYDRDDQRQDRGNERYEQNAWHNDQGDQDDDYHHHHHYHDDQDYQRYDQRNDRRYDRRYDPRYEQGWGGYQTEFAAAQQRGYRDGIDGARKDFQNHRRPDVRNRDEFRDPNFIPRQERRDYQYGFKRGYDVAVQQIYSQQRYRY